jgi:hypothetical protein
LTIAEAPDAASIRWRKSSHSGGGNNCVEVAQTGATYTVRDSKNPDDGNLIFDASTWQAFVTDVERGTYDL